MAPQRKASAQIIDYWTTYRNRRIQEGVYSTNRIATELAATSHGAFSWSTIRRWIDPEYRKRHAASIQRITKRKRADRRRGRDRSRRRRNQNLEAVRRYERNYVHLTRYPQQYLEIAFGSEPETSIDHITSSIRAACENVPFQPRTIEKILKKYADGQRAGTVRGPPYLKEISRCVWRYDDEPPAWNHGTT